MTPLQQLKAVIQKANPEIKALPEYPYNPDVAKAIVEIEKNFKLQLWNEDLQNVASLHIENYNRQRNLDYRLMLENKYLGRPIRLADVLLAISKHLKRDGSNFTISSGGVMTGGNMMRKLEPKIGFWNLSKDSLDDQSPETIAFLATILL